MASDEWGTQVIRFRAGDLLPDLQQRAGTHTSPSLIAKRDLERYYTLLASAGGQHDVVPGRELAGAERQAVVEFLRQALRSPVADDAALPGRLPDLWASRRHTGDRTFCAHCLPPRLCDELGVSHSAIAAKLRYCLPMSALYALVDEAERPA
jgi:hypothetical protein